VYVKPLSTEWDKWVVTNYPTLDSVYFNAIITLSRELWPMIDSVFIYLFIYLFIIMNKQITTNAWLNSQKQYM